MFKDLQFQGKWRSYQQAILDDLDTHIEDEKLHVVAAPGAGKTILGLEVIRRIGKPCLIFAPTITIKNQWASRLKQSFMSDKSLAEELISTNILKPKMITVATYQGLLAGLSGRAERDVEEVLSESDDADPVPNSDKNTPKLTHFKEDKAQALIDVLKQANIQVLCFDEAHHLRREWWKALDYVMENLKPQKTVSLTATPPYDVDINEWKRYETLCGPVDAEISIPELVQVGDLCPHQDLIYFAPLRENEKTAYREYEKEVAEFSKKMRQDVFLAEKLLLLDFWENAPKRLEILFDDPDFYLALASYIKSHNLNIPNAFLKVFDLSYKKVPNCTDEQIELMLNGLLFQHRTDFTAIEDVLESLHVDLKKAGLIDGSHVYFGNKPVLSKMAAKSLGKLDAIEKIVQREVKELKSNLRMVILADLIKYDCFVDGTDALGVVPIFRHIDSMRLDDVSLGILTGRIILLPEGVKHDLISLMRHVGFSEDAVSFSRFKYAPNYVEVKAKESVKSKIVDLITDLFNQGKLTIMVGTQALLGEGWDAPAINSLILSSTVSTYMLSNQMRGRAIRVDKNNPDKISHIWHLANIIVFNFKDALQGEEGDIGGDYEALVRRFKGFEAPDLLSPYNITNGMDRCCWGQKSIKLKEKNFNHMNERALEYSRSETKLAWEKGLVIDGDISIAGRMDRMIQTNAKVKSLPFFDTYILQCLGVGYLAYWTCQILQKSKAPLYWYAIILLIAALILIPSTWKMLRASKPERILKQIALVVLESLYDLEVIDTLPQRAGLDVMSIQGLYYEVKAPGLNQKENHFFIEAMKEFLNPIQNPRYLLMRKNSSVKLWQQVDYHAIPAILTPNKKAAMNFKHHWQDRIGSCNVIYTRTIKGRRMLLKGKVWSYSSLKNTFADTVGRWIMKY